jgi:hypothetical protein
MVQVGAHAFAVNDSLAIVQSVEVSAARAVVKTVGFLSSQARTRVFDDASAFADGSCSENTD